MPDKSNVSLQKTKNWYVENWSIEANNNTYYSLMDNDAAAAQVAKTSSYIEFYPDKDFRGLEVKGKSKKTRLLNENFPFFQKVSGDGLCGFHAAIVGTLAKCADNTKSLKEFRKKLEEYPNEIFGVSESDEAREVVNKILKKIPKDNLTFDQFYELVSEAGEENISKKLANILFKNADFSPKSGENPAQKEARESDLESQKKFIKDSKKAKIMVSDFAIADVMKSISPFKLETVTSENLESFFGKDKTQKDTIYLVNGDGQHFDLLYSKSDENIVKAAKKVSEKEALDKEILEKKAEAERLKLKEERSKTNVADSRTKRITPEQEEARRREALVSKFNAFYKDKGVKDIRKRKISFDEKERVVEFSSEVPTKEVAEAAQNLSKHELLDAKDKEILEKKAEAERLKLKEERSKTNVADSRTKRITPEQEEARRREALVSKFNAFYKDKGVKDIRKRKISFDEKERVVEFSSEVPTKEVAEAAQNLSKHELLDAKKWTRKELNPELAIVSSTDKRDNQLKHSDAVDKSRIDVVINKFEKHRKQQKAIEILVKPNDKQKDNYKIFDNKLIRALEKNNEATSKLGKGKEKEIWKSLTTLDKRVLVESYNQSHKGSEIDFDSLFRLAQRGEKAELTVRSENYVLDESKISDLKKVLDYSLALKAPNPSTKKTAISVVKSQTLGPLLAQ